MTNPITIRDAVLGDEAELGELTAAIHALHVAERPDVFKPATAADFERSFAERLRARTSQILIAESAGVMVGHAVTVDEHRDENHYLHARRWCEIQQIGVRPEYRRRGVARRLIQHVVASADAGASPASSSPPGHSTNAHARRSSASVSS